jgi:hypothetical protein
VSRATRASIASSLCALSLVASACGGGGTHGAADVRAAFAGAGFAPNALDALLSEFSSSSPRVRPLDSLLAFVRAAAHGTIDIPPPAPYPKAVVVAGNADALIFASTSSATRAERALEWLRTHGPHEDFGLARRDNVVVTYPPAVERRVLAALDRLD